MRTAVPKKPNNPTRRETRPQFYPYACFRCRRSFKRAVVEPIGLPDKVCPNCGATAVGLSRKFKAPAQADEAQWQKVEYLVASGFRFETIRDTETGEPVAYPETMAEARKFVAKYGRTRV